MKQFTLKEYLKNNIMNIFNRLKIRRQYKKLVAGIEEMEIYDGRHKGTNIYECYSCGRKLYTYYKDKGVTSFTVRCPKCLDTMIHINTIRATPIPWVRPTFKQLLKLSPEIIEHVLQGGLILETHLNKKHFSK